MAGEIGCAAIPGRLPPVRALRPKGPRPYRPIDFRFVVRDRTCNEVDPSIDRSLFRFQHDRVKRIAGQIFDDHHRRRTFGIRIGADDLLQLCVAAHAESAVSQGPYPAFEVAAPLFLVVLACVFPPYFQANRPG